MELKPFKKKVFVPAISSKKFYKDKIYYYSEKMFPGYVLIECGDSDYKDIFSNISNIPGVLNMSSIRNINKTSAPIYSEEILTVLKHVVGGTESYSHRLENQSLENRRIKIIEGPFSNFEGIVLQTNKTANKETKVKVCTNILNNGLLSTVIVPISQIELMEA